MNVTDDLLLRLDFRDPKPEVIDISPEGGVVNSLRESKIECLSADKVCKNFRTTCHPN
jgi:ATP-dependent RNA helicase DDX24/MAK5